MNISASTHTAFLAIYSILAIGSTSLFSALSSAALQVNTATMKVGVSIHGMRPAPHNLTPLQASSAAVLAPGGGELVLPADNSMLQFWDAARDCHVDRLQVCTRVSTPSPPQTKPPLGLGRLWSIRGPPQPRLFLSFT